MLKVSHRRFHNQIFIANLKLSSYVGFEEVLVERLQEILRTNAIFLSEIYVERKR